MKEHALFVPYGSEHLAAVVSTPDVQARGLVLLLQGAGGATRSHRNRLWTRVAHRLADVGIATARFDYPGIGDSSGVRPSRFDAPPLAEARAVLELSMDALDLSSFAVVGNCMGVSMAFSLAQGDARCSGVGAILPVSLGPIMRREKSSSNAAWAEVLRLVRTALRRLGVPLGAGPIPAARAVARSIPVLVLHGGGHGSARRLQRQLRPLTRAAARGSGRVEFRILRDGSRPGFRSIAIQDQQIDILCRWLDEVLPRNVSVGPFPTRGDASVVSSNPARYG
jgi:pimeloyl-ACP methyl ester carboxylesterase